MRRLARASLACERRPLRVQQHYLSQPVTLQLPSTEPGAGEYEEWGGGPVGEGSFRFYIDLEGTFKATITNPSASSPRSITFAWLKGARDRCAPSHMGLL